MPVTYQEAVEEGRKCSRRAPSRGSGAPGGCYQYPDRIHPRRRLKKHSEAPEAQLRGFVNSVRSFAMRIAL